MRGRLTGGLLAALLLAGPLAACSGDDDDDGDATVDTTTTTDSAPGDATAEAPGVDFEPVDHREDGGTDGDVLLDGRHFGYVTTLVAEQDEVMGQLDLAEVFYGEDAEQAILEDGPDALETGRDFYVRNENPILRTIRLDPGAAVFVVDRTSEPCCDLVRMTPAQLVAHRASTGLDRTPAELTIQDGVVTRLVQVYVP